MSDRATGGGQDLGAVDGGSDRIQAAIDDDAVEAVADQPVVPARMGEAIHIGDEAIGLDADVLPGFEIGRPVAAKVAAHAGDVGGSGFHAAGDADVAVEHAIGVVIAIEKHGEGGIDLGGDGGGMAERGTELELDRGCGGERGIDSGKSAAQATVRGVAESGCLGQNAGAERGGLTVGKIERGERVAATWRVRSWRAASAWRTSAARVRRISAGTAATVAVAARTKTVAATASALSAASSAQTSTC